MINLLKFDPTKKRDKTMQHFTMYNNSTKLSNLPPNENINLEL